MKMLKKVVGTVRRPVQSARWAHASLVAGAVVMSNEAMAQEGLKGWIGSGDSGIIGQIMSVRGLIVVSAGVAGLGLVAWGLWKLFMRPPQSQEGPGKALLMVFGGGALLGVSAIAAMTSSTIGGGNSDVLDGI